MYGIPNTFGWRNSTYLQKGQRKQDIVGSSTVGIEMRGNNIDETKKIDENLINKFAPKVVDGVNKLKNWSENL